MSQQIRGLLYETMLVEYQQSFVVYGTDENRNKAVEILDPLKDYKNGWRL